MAKTAAARGSDDSLAIRAAWLHYAGGLTQVEVAERLGVSNAKAHRLISWAYQSGAIRVTVVGDVAECVMLESEISRRYGLAYCEIVPDLHEDGLPLRALGSAGASFLRREIEGLKHGIIGLGHGRTLAAAIAAMPHVDAGPVRFVSLMGGLMRNYAANPHDVMHRMAEKANASAYVMPIPFAANTAADRDVLLSQRGVAEVAELTRQTDLMVVGIGTVQLDAQLVATGMIYLEEIEEVRRRGGVGEMLGHFFDTAGQPVETSLASRIVTPPLDHLKGRRIVAFAGGPSKIDGIAAVLHSGYLAGLITDERTARELMSGQAS
ncbi:sugar-binding transcriptional regulator [Mangrovicella endophytica]|uniref:sugar-binding transcriptional regulator n=1 Tax=Mangrovicella endophytica TaxID=2066697 RepID=UPI000C9DF369|nr:sugar-binding transcriptional regulator [Mangrovicella endophytica]